MARAFVMSVEGAGLPVPLRGRRYSFVEGADVGC
jgi:hypothetical protein